MISDDEVQDYHSVHKEQQLVKGCLEEQLKIKISKLHEFTDGCAAQYKSRHCIRDLSCSLADYAFNVQRSYFETSHAKGEQDAAGANVKQNVSQAVLRKTAVIRNAKNMKDFLAENFTTPAASSFVSRNQAIGLSRRVFLYVPTEGEEAVVRCRPGRTLTTNRQILGITAPFSLMTIGNQFPEEKNDCGHTSKIIRVGIVTAFKQ